MALGVEVKVATTNDDGARRSPVEPNRWITHDEVPVFYADRMGPKGDLAPALHRCIRSETAQVDLVHVAPIFSWPTLSAARACRRHRKPLVVSPRGSLAPEALAWRSWKKGVFLAAGGRRALQQVKTFHATTPAEAQDVSELFPGAAVAVVPNGVDVPSGPQLRRWVADSAAAPVLYLGRLHPHKNVDLLIAAWARVAAAFPERHLLLAGTGEPAVVESLKTLSQELGIASRVRFAGHVEGEEKSRLLARAAVLVLPSKSENFGNAIAEALAHGTPVIASTGTPWPALRTNRCGWWVQPAIGPVAEALMGALRMDTRELQGMGDAGRDWMTRDFAWPAVASRMRDFYAELVERNSSAR